MIFGGGSMQAFVKRADKNKLKRIRNNGGKLELAPEEGVVAQMQTARVTKRKYTTRKR